MNDMEQRRERLLALLDTALSYVDDGPIYENYTSRNILNYLRSIQAIDQITGRKKDE
ncbi:hypothetical protein [Ruminococcus gauvreauii]|uniref:hypothetical protein n=1 Tax=Ruminococcus gauvreauii TaxID=438033 RepID=UPI00398421EF